jgi:hypothetical protein
MDMSNTDTVTPITHEAPGRDLDVTTLRDQVGMWTWAEMGTKWNTALRHRDALQVDIKTGPRRTHRLFIKLNGADLFDLEIGRMRKRRGDVLPAYEVVEQVRDVDAEALRPALRALFARHAQD